MPTKWFILVLTCLVFGFPAIAEETILFCSEQHIVGLEPSADDWEPRYASHDHGQRYAIRFNGDKSQMSGFQGGKTVFQCRKHFPNKAPDAITCINPLVATMVFNYSTESERFLVSFVSPGGWLGVGTQREEVKEPFADYLIMGTCQDF